MHYETHTQRQTSVVLQAKLKIHPPSWPASHDKGDPATKRYPSCQPPMKVHIKHWGAVAQWHWNTGNNDPDDEGDVCGICRVRTRGVQDARGRLSAEFIRCFLGAVWGECSHICIVCSSGSGPLRSTAVPDGPSDVRCVSFSSSYRVVHAIVQSLQNAASATSNSGSGAVCLLLLCNPCITTYNVFQVEDKLAVNTSIHHSNTRNFKLFLSNQPIEMKMHYVCEGHAPLCITLQ